MRWTCRAAAEAVALGFLVVGCAGSAAASPASPSGGPRHGAHGHSATPKLVRWERFDEASAWQPVGNGPYPSAGHAPPRYVATTRVRPEDRVAYESLVTDSEVPVGFVAAIWLQERGGRPGPVYAMEKRSAGWRFFALDRSGFGRTRDLTLCARCHAEAPVDHLFGLPRPIERTRDPKE